MNVTDTTPDGRWFAISDNGESRRLEWHARGDIGSTGVPIKRNQHTAKLLGELRTYGAATDSTWALCKLS